MTPAPDVALMRVALGIVGTVATVAAFFLAAPVIEAVVDAVLKAADEHLPLDVLAALILTGCLVVSVGLFVWGLGGLLVDVGGLV